MSAAKTPDIQPDFVRYVVKNKRRVGVVVGWRNPTTMELKVGWSAVHPEDRDKKGRFDSVQALNLAVDRLFLSSSDIHIPFYMHKTVLNICDDLMKKFGVAAATVKTDESCKCSLSITIFGSMLPSSSSLNSLLKTKGGSNV